MSPFRLAILNLFRRPLSTWIAILGIAAAVAASGILLKIYLLSQSRFQTLANEGQSIVGAKAGGIEILLGSLNLEGPVPGFVPYNLFLSIKAQQNVKFEDGAESKPSYVKGAIPFLYFAHYGPYRVLGTTGDFLHRPFALDSPELAGGAWFTKTGDVVIGSRVAREKSLAIGQMIRVQTVTGRTTIGIEMNVTGILKSTGKIWDYALFSSLADAQGTLGRADISSTSIWGANVLHYFLLYHDPAALAPLRSLIDQRTVAQLVPIDDAVARLEKLTGTGRAFGILLTCLILFLSSSSVASMMVARFDAMSTQLAILRAIGYERAQIARWLLWEGFILGVVACSLGAAVDFAFFPLVRGLSGLDLPEFVPDPVFASPVVWAGAIVVTIAAVAIPLLRLYRQDVNASLKA